MSKRVGFMVYNDWREVLNDFDDKLYRELMEAIFDLGLENKETAKSPLVKVAMKLIKPQILRDWKKYEERCNRNKLNGLQGGRPKTQINPENPVGLQKSQITHSVFSVSEKPNEPTGEEKIKNKKEEIKNEIEKILESEDSLSVATDSNETIFYQEILDYYNKCADRCNLIKCVRLTEKRKAAIRARIKEYKAETIFEVIRKCAESSFCNGHNDRNWRADFDFVFNANKMARILEGKYDNNNNSYGTNRNDNSQRAQQQGELAFANTIAEIEERRRTEGTLD